MDSIAQEQDPARTLPDRFEPRGLGARVQQCDPVAVLGETGDPVTNLVSAKRRIQINEKLTRPRTIQAVTGPLGARAGPWARVSGTRIQVERPERIDDPARGDVVLRK